MFWVLDFKEYRTKPGRFHPVVIGGHGFSVEGQAQRYLDQAHLSSRAKVYETKSSNYGVAIEEIKAQLILERKSLDEGMERIFREDNHN